MLKIINFFLFLTILDNAITIGYWSIRGLGAPLRAMVMYAGVPLNNVMYDLVQREDGSFDASSWISAKPALKARNPLMNLPYIIDGEHVISQSNACLVYLGRRLDLWGRDLEEMCDCEQLLCELMDLRNIMTDFCYASREFDADAATKIIQNVQGAKGILQKLELWLDKNATAAASAAETAESEGTGADDKKTDEVAEHHSGAFLVGNHATAPDFHLYELLVQYSALNDFLSLPPFLSAFPKLDNFKHCFEALPGNARYLNSKLGAKNSIPFNNKTARFGADVSGGVWVKGTAYDFHSYTGIF